MDERLQQWLRMNAGEAPNSPAGDGPVFVKDGKIVTSTIPTTDDEHRPTAQFTIPSILRALIIIPLVIASTLISGTNAYRTDCLTAQGTVNSSWHLATTDQEFGSNCEQRSGTKVTLATIGLVRLPSRDGDALLGRISSGPDDAFFKRAQLILWELNKKAEPLKQNDSGSAQMLANINVAIKQVAVLHPTPEMANVHAKLTQAGLDMRRGIQTALDGNYWRGIPFFQKARQHFQDGIKEAEAIRDQVASTPQQPNRHPTPAQPSQPSTPASQALS